MCIRDSPLWPCGTPGRDGAEAAAKAAASPGSNPPPRGSRGAGSACPVLRSKQGPIGRPAGLGAPISGQLAEGRPETAGRGRSPTLSRHPQLSLVVSRRSSIKRALVRPVRQACHGRTTYSQPPAAWSARPAALPRRIRREAVGRPLPRSTCVCKYCPRGVPPLWERVIISVGC